MEAHCDDTENMEISSEGAQERKVPSRRERQKSFSSKKIN